MHTSRILTILALFVIFSSSSLFAQQDCDCPYPVIFVHGFLSNQDFWKGTYDNPDFENIWGGETDTFFSVLNATDQSDIKGNDNILGTADDDVLFQFVNEDNNLKPGCIYLNDWQNW